MPTRNRTYISVPSKPTIISVKPINATAVRVSWSKPVTDNGGKIKGYYVFYDLVDRTNFKQHTVIGEEVYLGRHFYGP